MGTGKPILVSKICKPGHELQICDTRVDISVPVQKSWLIIFSYRFQFQLQNPTFAIKTTSKRFLDRKCANLG